MGRRWPRIPPLEARTRNAWRYLQRNCRARGIRLHLSQKLFQSLIDDNCYYCGTFPKNRQLFDYVTYLYQGIDRVDNAKGYVKGNVVPCCIRCNSIKGNKLSHEEMIFVARTLKQVTRAAVLLRSALEPLILAGSRRLTRKGARR